MATHSKTPQDPTQYSFKIDVSCSFGYAPTVAIDNDKLAEKIENPNHIILDVTGNKSKLPTTVIFMKTLLNSKSSS